MDPPIGFKPMTSTLPKWCTIAVLRGNENGWRCESLTHLIQGCKLLPRRSAKRQKMAQVAGVKPACIHLTFQLVRSQRVYTCVRWCR